MVTGLGLVTPIGLGVKAAWESLLKGACGIKSITADDLPKVRQRRAIKLSSRLHCKEWLQSSLMRAAKHRGQIVHFDVEADRKAFGRTRE